MAPYLRARTAFFDRVVVSALDRGVSQVVNVGAGYDGRPWRYARPGVTWWEADRAETQTDKIQRLDRLGIDRASVTFLAADLAEPGLARLIRGSGFRPEDESLLLCEGVVIYLPPAVVLSLLSELRSLAAPGSRLAVSMATSGPQAMPDTRRDLRRALADIGEPAANQLTHEDLSDLAGPTGWRVEELSEAADRAGFVLLAPV
jgi:methyltransferase (TIGR00027 family)